MEKNRNQKLSARPLGRLTLLAVCALLVSCITVNVNFPESAVQRAADDFVRDLYKPVAAVAENSKANASNEAAAVKSSVKKDSKKKEGKAPASPAPKPVDPTSWHFSLGIAEAFAQEINTSSPKAQTIKDRMKGRVGGISKWKSSGVVCETADGMLVVKNAGKAGGEAGAVAKLVKDENDDRDALYAEIQDVNKIADRKQTKIRKFFAAAFKENSPPGTCFEQ